MKNLYAENIIEFQNYLAEMQDDAFALDLTSMNIFDCLKFMVLSSTYFSQKFPEGKLKCKVQSDDVKSLLSAFDIRNLEFI